jgi:hypothetical protein
MKKNYVIVLTIMVLLGSCICTAQTTLWANSSNGQGDNDYGTGICIDSQGNIISTGYFEGLATFGTETLVSAGSTDMALQKFSADGTRLWTKRFGGFGEDYIYDVVTDTDDNIYVCGKVMGTAYFNDIAVTGSLFNQNYYVVKLDSNGTPLWGRVYPGSPNEKCELAIDSNNVLHLMGCFQDTQAYGNFSLNASNGNLFVLKINTAGTVTGALQMASQGSTSRGSMFIDGANNLYVTGSFINTSNFGNTVLTNNSNTNFFVTKINPEGTFLWAKQMTGNTSFGSTITADSAGNIYVTGFYYGTAQFESQTLQAQAGHYSHFIMKLNGSGTLTWLNSYNTNDVYGRAHPQIVIGNSGQLYHMFSFEDNMTFMGTDYTADSPVLEDALFSRLNSDGTFAWHKQFRRFNFKNDNLIATDGDNNLYVTGGIWSATFDGIDLDNDSAPEILVAKIADATAPELGAGQHSLLNVVVQNPVTSSVNINLGKEYSAVNGSIYTVTGQRVAQFRYNNVQNMGVPLNGSSGLYIITVEADGLETTLKVIKE